MLDIAKHTAVATAKDVLDPKLHLTSQSLLDLAVGGIGALALYDRLLSDVFDLSLTVPIFEYRAEEFTIKAQIDCNYEKGNFDYIQIKVEIEY